MLKSVKGHLTDVDFATYEELKPIEKILKKYGFKRLGRSFNHNNCPYLIDFVNAVYRFEKLQTISDSLADCVKDRLASFFHWDDKQALDQAGSSSRCKKYSKMG